MPRRVLLAACCGLAWALAIRCAAAAVSLVPVGAFDILPGESFVSFMVPDNRGGFTGRTTRVSGQIAVAAEPGGEAYEAQVHATVDAASLTTGNGSRDASMRSAYLKTAEFPTIAFDGTATARPGLAVRPFPGTVRGRLRIRDVLRDAQFPATITALGDEFLADAVATVRMAEYQIPSPRFLIFAARDPVTVTLHIRAKAHR
jgi:polyisoprenoid-binding protein YceI